MKKLVTAFITVTYECPMWVENEAEMAQVFQANRKEIMSQFETDYDIQETHYEWRDDIQVFRKEGTWLDVGSAKLMERED